MADGYWIIEWEAEDGSHYEKVVSSEEDGWEELDAGDYPDNAEVVYVNQPFRFRVTEYDEVLAEQGGEEYI